MNERQTAGTRPAPGTEGAMSTTKPSPGVLIIVENLGVPFDRRVWTEALTLRDAGYGVSIICPAGMGHEPGYELLEGIHVYRHPLREASGSGLDYLREYATALAWEFRLARRVHRERGFEVVHICNPPDLLFLVAGWFKIFFGARVVFDHHDINPELYEDKYGRRDVFYLGLRLAERLTFAVADIVISTNESFRRLALERGGKRPDEVFVVRSSPDVDTFTRLEAREEYRRGRRHLVGYVGVMGDQDGVDLLLRAAAILVHEQGRDIHVMLIGGGPALPSLKQLAADLGIEEHVEFAGFQRGEELRRRLSSCDVGVSPDPATPFNTKCTMNKVLEYMTLGLPLVQFELEEGRASAADASLYARDDDPRDLAENIGRLLDDPDLRAEMGRIGRSRIRDELGWHHQRGHLLAAYEAVLR